MNCLDEFKNFFSKYGKVVDHQIIRDHATNRSRGFGFIIFDSEQVVDDLLANGNMIDLAGSQVSWVRCLPPMSVWILILDFSISQVAIYIFLGDMHYRFRFFFIMLSLNFFSLYITIMGSTLLWVLLTLRQRSFTVL